MEKDVQEKVNAYLIPDRAATKPNITCIINDTPATEGSPEYASRSLPEGLEIRDSRIPEAGLGVWAVRDFEEGTRFGPYGGVKVDKVEGYKSGYAWEIRSEDGQGEVIHCIDAQDVSKGNWMRYVNCACKESEQNLRSYQDGEDIFYLAYKPIKDGTELLTFYGEEYSRKLGIETEPSTVETDEIHLCNICGQLLTSAEFLSRHLKYRHQSRLDVTATFNPNADVSKFLKAVEKGKTLLEQAVNQQTTSPTTSTPKAAPKKSRGSASSPRAVKSTKPSKAPSSSKNSSDDLILLDDVDNEVRLTDDELADITAPAVKSTKPSKAPSSSKNSSDDLILLDDVDNEVRLTDDELADITAPDPVVCTWFEDVQDWAEGLIGLEGDGDGGDGDVEEAEDKTSPEPEEDDLEWHLCHECGQLFDEEEFLEIHVAARHSNGSAGDTADDPSKSDPGKVNRTDKGLIKKTTSKEKNRTKKGQKTDGTKSGNIFDKFGPLLGKRPPSDVSHIPVATVFAENGTSDIEEETSFSVENDGSVNSSVAKDDDVKPSEEHSDRSGPPALNGIGELDEDPVFGGNDPAEDEIEDLRSDVELVRPDKPVTTLDDIFSVEDVIETDETGGDSSYAFNSDSNILKEYVEVLPLDVDDEFAEDRRMLGDRSANLSGRKIEEGMSQEAWRKFICSICRKACHNKQALIDHQKTHTFFQCSTCFLSFLDEESLAYHEREHKERPFHCDICGKTYKHAFSLKEHKYSHTGHRPFVCPYCPQGFMRNKKLKLHIKKMHKNLMRAAQKPPPPPLVLEHNNQFNDSAPASDLDILNCKFCGSEFFDSEELRDHEATCNNGGTSTMADVGEKQDEEHRCEVCSRTYPSKSMLERHRKIHGIWVTSSSSSADSSPGRTDNMLEGSFPDERVPPRPFKCQLCESTFKEESHLQIHVEIHSMDPPWSCVVCKRKLKQRAHLLEHMYTHWEYKPYACLYCPADFMRTYDVEKHMKEHKQRQPQDLARVGMSGDSSNGGEAGESSSSILQGLLTKPKVHDDSLAPPMPGPGDAFGDDDVVDLFQGSVDVSHTPMPVVPLRCPDDGKSRPYACEMCDRAFTAKSSLREHLFLHFGKPYPCDLCERQFTRKAYLVTHMKEMHPEADTSAIEDSVLDAKYEEIINKALERHQSTTDHKKSIQSAQANEGYNPYSTRPYVCKVCGKSFEFSATLKKHMQAHIKLKPLLCDFCERRFVRQSYLDEHIKTQHPPGQRSKDPNRPFKCEICDLTFTKRAYLKDHRYRHKLKKPFPCSFCSKSFRRRCLLMMHISRHHPNEHRQTELKQSNPGKMSHAPLPATNTLKIKLPFQKQKSSPVKKDPLMCHECGATFSSIANVRRHMRIHSGERPFACKFCPWSFNRKEVWRGHMKTKHANEIRAARNKMNPGQGQVKKEGFNCHKCGGSFKSSYALSVHLKQHSQGSSSRPWKCALCDLAFIRQSDRTKHLKFVHGLDQDQIAASGMNDKQIKQEPVTTPPTTPTPASTSQGVTLPGELHVCHRCGSRFDSFWGLESHSRVHEKHSRFPRPYKCVECGAAFKGQSNHTRHMRVHTPEYIAETKILLNKMPGRKTRVQSSTVPQNPVSDSELPVEASPFTSGSETRPHVCPKCGTGYKYARNLRKHIPRHIKSSDRPFQCKICGIYAKSKTSITKHSQIHGRQGVSVASVASAATSSASLFSCQKCGNSFTTKQELLKHLATHAQSVSSQSSFKCKYCNAGFKHRGSLTIHERSHSKLNFGFKRERGYALNALKNESIFRNGNKQVYVIKGLQCPVCMKTFTRRSGVSNHKKVHPDVEFVWEEELQGSVDMTSDRPYQCRICLMRFMRRSGLSNHMHSHRVKGAKKDPSPMKAPVKEIKEENDDGYLLNTDTDLAPPTDAAPPSAEDRPFSCEQCLCTFKTKGSLTTHTKVHEHDGEDERNHVCDICQCRFISSTNLKKHQRIHTGQPGTPVTPVRSDPAMMYSQFENGESIDIKTKRPFRCRLCGETFKAKHLLDDHMEVHNVSPRQFAAKQKEQIDGSWSVNIPESSGEGLAEMTDRPHACPICGDRFRLRTTKYKHLRLHKQSSGKPYRCAVCGLGFYSVGNMTKHLRRAHRKFSNSAEGEVDSVSEMLNSFKPTAEPQESHRPIHPSPSGRSPNKSRPYACKYCGDTFTMRCNMNRHRKRHETGDNLPFRCSHCGFGFKSTKERTKHIMRVHNENPADNVQPDPQKPIRTGLKTYKCPICSDTFGDSSGIYKHLRVHARSANKPFKCNVCKIGYNTMVGLSRHRGRVKHFAPDEENAGITSQTPSLDIKPNLNSLKAGLDKTMHKCHYCPATYRDRSSVWRHERVHKLGVSSSRPFSCKMCGFACYTKSQLERHSQMHRNTPGYAPPDLPVQRKKQTSERCKRCGLAFRTKSLYLVHMKRCMGSSTFVCKICSVTFSNQIMLTKHVRQDHGGLQRDVINLGGRRIIRETGHDKKFCCDQCDQRYKRPSELEKHLRRHALGFIRPQKGFTPPVIKQEEDESNMDTRPDDDQLPQEENVEDSQASSSEVVSTNLGRWGDMPGRTPVHNRTNTKSERARPFVCQTCGFAFMTLIHLRKHTRLHKIAHTKPFVCKICTLGYTRLLDYRRHCNVVHPWGKKPQDESQVRCPRCKENFDNKTDLVQHLEKQTCKFVDDLPEADTNQGGDGSEAVTAENGQEDLPNRAPPTSLPPGSRDLKCPICGYQFWARPHLETHMKNHDNWENQPFKCERCQIGYSTKQHLSKHVNQNPLCVKLAREKERKRKLDEMSDVASSSVAEPVVERSEPGQFELSLGGKIKRHVCHHCNKSFVKAGQLRVHLELHKPSPDRPHVCKYCGMGYKTISNYAKHMKWEHSRNSTVQSQSKLTAAIYMCRDCGYSVTNKSLLEEHTRFGCPKKKENPATEAPQACPVCGNYFNSANMLCIHIHEHIYDKLFRCSKCPLRFSNPKDRKEHEQNHPDWNNMLLQLLSSEFSRRLSPEGVRIKTEPGLEEEVPVPYVPEKMPRTDPMTGVLVVKPEPVDEPEYNYNLGSLEDSALFGDYQALIPDASDGILPSILQQSRRPEGSSSSASRLEKIVSNLAAQKPSTGSSQNTSRRASEENRTQVLPEELAPSVTPLTEVTASVVQVHEANAPVVVVSPIPDSETLAKQVSEIIPSCSPRIAPEKPSAQEELSKKHVQLKVAPAELKTTLTELKTAPAEQKTTSVEQKTNSVEQKITTAEQKVTPVEQKTANLEQKTTPKQKLFRCRYCPSAFRLKGMCMAHERQAHRKIYTKPSDTSNKPLKDLSKMSVCEICNAVFEQQAKLGRHMLFKHGVPLKSKEPVVEKNDKEIVGESVQENIKETVQEGAQETISISDVFSSADNGNISDGPYITSVTSQGNLQNNAVRHKQPSLLQQRLEAPPSPLLVRPPPSSTYQPMSRLESLLTRPVSPSMDSSLLTPSELDYRPYKCKGCNFAFTQRHHLVRHINRDSCAFHVLGRKAAAQLKGSDPASSRPAQSSGPSSRPAESQGPGSSKPAQGLKIKVAEKKYKCTKCPRAFWKRIRLENHMKVAHSEGLYQCSFCAKEFKLKVDCIDHEDSCPFGPGAMDSVDMNGGDLRYKHDIDLGHKDLDLGPDQNLEQEDPLDLEENLDLGPDEDLDLGPDEDLDLGPDEDLDLGPDEELERAQEQAFADDQNMDYGFENSSNLPDPLGESSQGDQQWMGIQIKQEPLD